MASETITQNDLREILSRTVGSVPSEYKKLLWANPSPTSAFSAQTVSLYLSNYDDVEVEFMCWNTEQQEMASVTVAIGASGRMVSPLAVCAFRKFSVTSTSVAFENAQAYPNYGNWALGTQNNACIPYRIYGIKYERVAPPQIEVPKKMELLRVSSGLANTNYTLADSISNYDIISIVALSSYSNRWGTMIPASVFAETTNNYLIYLGTEANVYNLAVHYSNDITIGVAAHGTGTIGLVVTGFKL